jgi:hypothetical protein
MRKSIVLALSVLGVFVTSCRGVDFYQVYKTESESVKIKGENSISYEDAQCRIDYNLFSEYGDAGFSFFNKTDEVIHLLLDESYYVSNGNAYDYYQNRIFQIGNNYSFLASNSNTGYKNEYTNVLTTITGASASNHSNSISFIEPKIISIPSKTKKSIRGFAISNSLYRDCELFLYPTSKQEKTKYFTSNNSPIILYNTITYRVGVKDNKVKIKNDFYVSEITNLPDTKMVKNVRKVFCGEHEMLSTTMFSEPNPEKFYIKYYKSQNSLSH